jgi:hypothetical protein
MNNIIDVEFCRVMGVTEHIRKQTKRTCVPMYTFIVELLLAERNITLNTILQDMDSKNSYCVMDKSNCLYTCEMVKGKRNKSFRKPKRFEIVSMPLDITSLVSDKTEQQPEKETCEKIDLGLDMNSLDKQINGNSDMLCLVYDDSNKLYCDLLQREVSENYDIRIIVKKK